MDRTMIETALDRGHLFVKMRNGNYWRCRRNGRTQTWKRDAARFRIPYKAGMYVHGALTESDLSEFHTYYKIETAL